MSFFFPLQYYIKGSSYKKQPPIDLMINLFYFLDSIMIYTGFQSSESLPRTQVYTNHTREYPVLLKSRLLFGR